MSPSRLFIATVGAAGLVALPALAQKGAPAKPALVVNGVVVTRDMIYDDLLADQYARMLPTDPRYKDPQRPLAASFGAWVMTKQVQSKGAPVTIARKDLVDWLFKDKPQVLLVAVENRTREMVIQQEAAKRGVKPDAKKAADQLKEALNGIRAQNQWPTTVTDKEVYSRLGYREATLKRAVSISVLLDKLVRLSVEDKIGHPLGPSDFLEAQHILIAPTPQNAGITTPAPTQGQPNPPAPDREKLFEGAKKKLDTAIAEIRGGQKTFEKAVLDYSDDGSKFSEGKLGIFLKTSMVPEFEKAAFALEPGKLSEPVRTQFGWHLIRVSRQGKDLTAPEREQAIQGMVRQRMRGYVEDLMKTAKIVNNVGKPQMPAGPAGQPGG